jgi:hypothetical protein
LVGLVVILFVALMVVLSAVKIVPEYERGVVFRLGRLIGARGPGLVLLIPIVERMVRVDTPVIRIDVPAQEVITLDNVPIKVNAVLYFMVRWDDIDFDRQQLTISGAVRRVRGVLRRRTPKTDASNRTLPVPAILLNLLRQHRAPQDTLRQNHDWQEHGLVFPSRIGTLISLVTCTDDLRRF